MRKSLEQKNAHRVDGQLVELAGRNWLMSQLLRVGIEVARPERDRGVDVIAYVEARREFVACPIQLKASLKASFTVYKNKYKNISGILLVHVWHVDDSTKTVAYALTPADARRIADKKGWTKKPSWKSLGYWRVPKVSEELSRDLAPFMMTPAKWKTKICQAVRRNEEL
jgi:hypothetical protein